MIEILVPGYQKLKIKHLVMDYNGTLACNGNLLNGVKAILLTLAASIKLHVLTADTFGSVKSQLKSIPLTVSIIPADNQDNSKKHYVEKLGSAYTACIGNGRNDRLMLKEACLGIGVIQEEGACAETLLSADIICKDILSALKLLTDTQRIIATLRL